MDFLKRPVAVLTLTAFLSFCVLANFFVSIKPWMLITAGCASSLFLATSFVGKMKRKTVLRLRYLFLICAGFFFGSLICFLNFFGEYAALYGDSEFDAKIVIKEVIWESERSVCYKADVVKIDTAEENFSIALESSERFEVRSVVSGKVYFSDFQSSETFDEKRYYMSKGMFLMGSISESVVVEVEPEGFFDFFVNINISLSERLWKAMSNKAASLADAVILGNKSGLSREIKRDFSKLGISHLIAISGMHISYISAAFFGVARSVRSGRRLSSFICIFLMLFYMGVTGFSASVTRAALLCCLLCLASLTGLCHDGITALGVCGLGMVCVCPHFAFDVGMQLSFSAYLGCLGSVHLQNRLRMRRIEKRASAVENSAGRRRSFFQRISQKAFRYVCSSLLVTVTVIIFTLPIMWLYYDSTSVVAILSNLIFIPLFSLVMYSGVGVLILSSLPWVGNIVSIAAQWFIEFVVNLSEKLASLDFSGISLRYPFAPFLIALLFAFCLLFLFGKKKVSAVCAVGMVLCIAAYGVGVAGYRFADKDAVIVSRIDGKNGDGLLVMQEGECYLCDFSDGSASEASRALVRVSEYYLENVDNIVLTKVRDGHVDLIKRLVETCYVKRVYLPERLDLKGEDAVVEINDYLDQKGVERITYSAKNGESLNFPFSFVLDIIGNPGLRIEGEETRFLYLPSSFEILSYTITLQEEGDGLCVLLGKTRKQIDESDLDKAKRIFDGAGINVVVSKKFKETYGDIEGYSLLSPDDVFTYRIEPFITN